jgi:hypothetical protein
MAMLPPQLAPIILTFAPVFNQRTWEHALVLLWGALLAPGKRTVTSALRIMGRSTEQQFQKYHRVLSRAVWDGRRASRLLLKLLLSHFAADGPVIVGIDDTLNAAAEPRLRPKESIGIRYDPRTRTSSRRGDCAG